jgi:hypothetical protein
MSGIQSFPTYPLQKNNNSTKNARIDDNQTPVVSNSRTSERNEKAGAYPVNNVTDRTGFYRHKLKAFLCAAFS